MCLCFGQWASWHLRPQYRATLTFNKLVIELRERKEEDEKLQEEDAFRVQVAAHRANCCAMHHDHSS